MKYRIFALLFCLAVLLMVSAGAVEYAGFPDVDGNTDYAEAIQWAAEQGYINGYSDGRFGVNDPVTRAQLAAIFYRAAGNPAVSGTSRFSGAGQAAWMPLVKIMQTKLPLPLTHRQRWTGRKAIKFLPDEEMAFSPPMTVPPVRRSSPHCISIKHSPTLRACLISQCVRIGEIDFLPCKAKSRSNPDGLQGFLTQSGRKICRQGGRGEMLNRL